MAFHLSEIAIASSFAGVAATAFTAYWTLGDREENLAKSLQGSKVLLEELGRRLLAALQQEISSALSEGPVSPILSADGSYAEKKANPVSGELFRERLKDFMESNAESMVEFSGASRAVRIWLERVTKLTWNLLALTALYGLAALVFFICAVVGVQLPMWAFIVTVSMSAPPILSALYNVVVMQYHRDRLVGLRRKYGCA